MKYPLFFAALYLLVASPVQLQAQQDKVRLEVKVAPDSPLLNLMPAGPHGFLLFTLSGKPLADRRVAINVAQYDTAMSGVGVFELVAEQKLSLAARAYAGKFAWFLFQDPGQERARLFRLDLERGELENYTFRLYKTLQVKQMAVAGERVWVSGTVRGQYMAVLLDTDNQRVRVLPTGSGLKTLATGEMLATPRGELWLSLKVQQNQQITWLLRCFDEKMRVKQDIKLPGVHKYDLADLVLFNGAQGSRQLHAFAFVSKNSKASPKGFGLFTIGDGQLQQQYFAEFDELPAMQRYTEISFAEGELATGKERKGPGNFETVNPELLPLADGRLLLNIEVFQEGFRTKNYAERETERAYRDFETGTNRNSYLPGGNPETMYNKPPSNTEIIELRYRDLMMSQAMSTGYRYAWSSLLLFNSNLQVQQQQGFSPNGLVATYVLRNQNFVEGSTGPALGLHDGHTLQVVPFSAELQPQQVQAYPTFTDLLRKQSYIRSGSEQFAQWYPGNLVSWGYQRFKDRGKEQDVFYVNKISLR